MHSHICFREKKVPSVPESLAKKRKRYAVVKALRLKAKQAEKKVSCSCIDVFWENLTLLVDLFFFCHFLGPQGNKEAHLQTGRKLPQGIQGDVQAWGPQGKDSPQSGELLCPSRTQTGLCHQDQRVSAIGHNVAVLEACCYKAVVYDVALFSPSYRPWWLILKISQIIWRHILTLCVFYGSWNSGEKH